MDKIEIDYQSPHLIQIIQLFIHHMTSDKYSFALCIDPETQKYYSINLDTQTVHIEEFSQDAARREFADIAHEACNEMKQIISWEAFDYGLTKQVDFYRRRKLPSYLLQAPKLKIPSYILEQPLQRSITFDTVFDERGEKKQLEKLEIDAEIYLVEYVDVIRSKELFVMEPERTLPKVFTCKLRLPNPVNEVIKVIIKMAFQKEQIELTTRKPDNQFVLKVFGSESYLYGNTTFVKYEYVRRCLRNKETAKLQLTEKKFKERSKFRRIVFERLKKEVDQGIFKELKWFALRHEEPFLWYPPTKLDAQYKKELKEQMDIEKKYLTIKAKIKDKQKEDFSFKPAELDRLREQLDEYAERQKYQMPHFVLKEYMIKKTEQRNLQAYNRILQIDSKMIFSGECEFAFDIKVVGVTRFNNVLKHKNNTSLFTPTKTSSLSIYFKFTYGNQVLQWKKFSPVIISNNISLGYNIEWSKLSCLPFESKLVVEFIAFSADQKEAVHVGTAMFNMFDETGYLLTGTQKTNIWPFMKPDLRTSGCIGSYRAGFILEDKDYSQIVLEFPKFTKKVRWSLRNSEILYNFGYNKIDVSEVQANPKLEEVNSLNSLLSYNPMRMSEYDEREKRILKICYSNYSNNSERYLNFLYCINWTNPSEVQKAINAREMLNKEKEEIVKSSHYIGVFSSRFVDEAVRLNAVDKLISATDDEIQLYLPQLVQALLSETVHQNGLSELLLERAVLSPYSIGQALFWELKNQLHKQFSFERFAVYFECLIMCSVLRKSFISQLKYHNVFQDLGDRIAFSNEKGITAKTNYLRSVQIPDLRKSLQIPFIIPVTPQKQNDDFIDMECSVLTSKKKSYILTLAENPARKKKRVQGDGIKPKPKVIMLQKVIYKSGYDIRLDQLVLQMMKMMDNIWLQKTTLDLKMAIYKITAITDMTGYIEVLGEFESWQRAVDASQREMEVKDYYDQYLLKNNPKYEDYLRSIDNFVRSTAGFFIASYLLGLYDNINGYDLLTKNGIFVHIGYENFLGSFKTKQPKQLHLHPHSPSPFQFTPFMKYVIEKHKMWEQFSKFCTDAYHEIRKNANYIIQMLMIMVSAGISQLYDESNVNYLIHKLSLEMTKGEAEEKMRREIEMVFGIELSKKIKEKEENIINLIPVPIVSELKP